MCHPLTWCARCSCHLGQSSNLTPAGGLPATASTYCFEKPVQDVLTARRASVWTMSLLGNLLTVQRLGAQLLLFRMCFVFTSGLRPTALCSTASIFTLDCALSNIATCPSPQFTMFYHLGYRLSLIIVTMRIVWISRWLNCLCISFATPP